MYSSAKIIVRTNFSLHTLLSLAGAVALLFFSSFLDRFLPIQRDIGSSSLDLEPWIGWMIGTSLLWVIAWAASGWHILPKQSPSRTLAILLILLGVFVLVAPYIWLAGGGLVNRMLPANLRLGIWQGGLTTDFLRANAAFISTLGLLGLLLAQRNLRRSTAVP